MGTASAHVYQTAARIQRLQNPGLQMVHQGGRALYDDEEFDHNVLALLHNLGKDPAGSARKGDAGTMAWMGGEAKRRANMKTRPLVCGVTKIVQASDSIVQPQVKHQPLADVGNKTEFFASLSLPHTIYQWMLAHAQKDHYSMPKLLKKPTVLLLLLLSLFVVRNRGRRPLS